MGDAETESILIGFLGSWKTSGAPFLLWWMLSSGMVILLAELIHRCVSNKRIALQAFLWNMTILVILLLPIAYFACPDHTQISISSLIDWLVKDEADSWDSTIAKEHLFELWNKQVRTGFESTRQSIGIFENGLEVPTLPTLNRNLSGYQPGRSPVNTGDVAGYTDGFHLVIASIYLVGILSAVFVSLGNRVREWRFLANTRRCDVERIDRIIQTLAQDIDLRRPIQTLLSDDNTSPVVFGLIKPKLVLPAFMVNTWKDKDIESIVYHELNHIHNRDCVYIQAVSILKTFLWFSPMLSWLKTRSDETREVLSDAQTIQHIQPAREYAHLMLRLAESIVPANGAAHVYFFTRHGEQVLRRFSRILVLGRNTETTCSNKARIPVVIYFTILLIIMGGFRITAYQSHAGIAPPGNAEFLVQNNEYRLESAEYYLAYSKVSGPFTLSAKIEAESADGRPLKGWAFLTVCSDFSSEGITYAAGNDLESRMSVWQGKITLDQRLQEGYTRGGSIAARNNNGRLRIVRDGNVLSMYFFSPLINDWHLHDEMVLEMTDPVYVGIGVWSEDLSRNVIGWFSDVKFIKSAK